MGNYEAEEIKIYISGGLVDSFQWLRTGYIEYWGRHALQMEKQSFLEGAFDIFVEMYMTSTTL